MLNRDVSLELTCPKCNGKFGKTIRELEGNPVVDCPNGHKVQIKSDDLTKGLKNVENSISRFKRDIEGMFK